MRTRRTHVSKARESVVAALNVIAPGQEPITRSLHLCCTLESALSNEELFLEQAFPRKSIVSEDVNVMSMTELRTDWLIGYYALGRDKFCPKAVSINNFSSERVDSEGLYER